MKDYRIAQNEITLMILTLMNRLGVKSIQITEDEMEVDPFTEITYESRFDDKSGKQIIEIKVTP